MCAKILPLLIATCAALLAETKSTLHDSNVTLPPGARDHTAIVFVSVAGLSTEAKDKITSAPRLTDTSSSAYPGATVEVTGPLVPTLGPDGFGAATWKFQVKVAGFPAAETQARKFLFEFGPIRQDFAYTLSNLGGRAFTWSVRSPVEWNLASPTKALPISVNIGDLAASTVRLHAADFQSAEKIGLSQADFNLCTTPSGDCDPPVSLGRRTSHTLYLVPKSHIPPGLFKGKASLIAAEKAEAEDLTVTTIYSKADTSVGFGWLLLAVGVLASFLAQVVLRYAAHRGEEKRLVALFRVRITELKEIFNKFSDPVKKGAKQWLTDLDRLTADLSEEKMKPLFRPLLPQPFEKEVTAAEDFKSHIEEATARFKHLKTLLFSGIQRADALGRSAPTTPDNTAKIEAASSSLAELLPTADVDAQVAVILRDLSGELSSPEPPQLAGANPQDDLRNATIQILAASTLAWIFWGAVAILSGGFLFILSNPAFGTSLDLLKCFAWGLGVSVAGQQTPQSGPSAVAASVGIKFPGVKP